MNARSLLLQIKSKAKGAMGGSSQAGTMDNTTTGQGNLGQGFSNNQGNLGQGFDNTSGQKLTCFAILILQAALRASLCLCQKIRHESMWLR